MSASKPSGVASEESTEQRAVTLPEAPVEPLAHHGEPGLASSEAPHTLGASQASVTAPNAGPQKQAAGPGGPVPPDGVQEAADATRDALAADDRTATQTAPFRRLGEYQLLDKLGEGGMGTVYRARHTKLKRLEAVKILPDRRLEDPQAVARFEREMEAVGRLNHPHIVQAHDAREVDGTHFLVMEYAGRGPAGVGQALRPAACGRRLRTDPTATTSTSARTSTAWAAPCTSC